MDRWRQQQESEEQEQYQYHWPWNTEDEARHKRFRDELRKRIEELNDASKHPW